MALGDKLRTSYLMSLVTLVWLTLFSFLAYAIAQDANIYDWLVMKVKLGGIFFARIYYLVRFHPRSPWVRFEIHRNAQRIAKELTREMESKHDL